MIKAQYDYFTNEDVEINATQLKKNVHNTQLKNMNEEYLQGITI